MLLRRQCNWFCALLVSDIAIAATLIIQLDCHKMSFMI